MSGTYTQEELTAFAIGELDEARAAEIKRLLADDPQGRQTVDELRSVAGLLSDQFAAEPLPKLTAAQRMAVQSAVPYDRRRMWVPLSLAASILVLLGAAFLAMRYWPAVEIVGGGVEPEKPVRLEIKYPRAKFKGTPPNVNVLPKPIYVPRGTSNLARDRTVTSNAQVPAGKLKMVTDGDKSGESGHYLYVGDGLKWVQIDLGARANVYAIAVWHYYDDGQVRAYRDVIVQISDDPGFSKYTTVLNTDTDRSAGLETGSDKPYFETVFGKVIDCKGVVGRYVRLYSKGNTLDDQNHYVEVEVHGKAIDAKATTALTPAPTPTAQPAPRSKAKPARRRVKKVPLIIKYPKREFPGTPVPMNEPNIQKPSGKPPKVPMMPKGTVNLALGKPVTSNEVLPLVGDLEMVTDGDKSGEDGHNVDIGFGLKWVQIDLQTACSVSAIGVWHYHNEARAYRDVVVRVSNDPDFIKYKTIFNADHDNSSGMGIGVDMGYVETRHGKLIWCPKLPPARYIRLYSKGNTSNDQNHYTEVEVYGRKPKGSSPTTKPAKTKSSTTKPADARKVKKVPLVIKYPRAMFKCTPMPLPNEPNVPRRRQRYPELLVVPEGTVNLALKKPVTSNEPSPIVGDLDMVTDGDKSCEDGHNVDIGFGLKWVQIDLQAASNISAICMWHYYRGARAYRDVVVRISDDPDFVTFKTVLNTDFDNSSGLGIGADMGYIETLYGKMINCGGIRGRYVRLYSKGNTSNDQNHYIEVGVYGRAIKPPSSAKRPEGLAEREIPLKIKFPKRMFCY
ncbi:MAG: hypothetical protein QGH60_08815 [Phycisphaerae bacterium]|jgi:hypothetical protein|nr:hypothetical protein [Phycisphaerae bacterium]